MKDKFGREVDYLRLSVTENCNLRCMYCMPENLKNRKEDNLTMEECFKTVRIFSELGIKKVRITGGEPLIRTGIERLVGKINSLSEIKEIAITTNGILLEKYLDSLMENGLTSLNISIDSLNRENFYRITRGGNLETVINSIDKAIGNNINVKINTVLIRDMNDSEITELVNFATGRGIDIRFIELMPIGCARHLKGMKSNEVIEVLKKEGFILQKRGNPQQNRIEHERKGPAEYYDTMGGKSRIGFISPLSSCFCDSCNRIRVTADGKIKQCLYYKANVDLKEVLRNPEIKDEEIKEILRNQIFTKNRKHEFNNVSLKDRNKEERIMSSIGG